MTPLLRGAAKQGSTRTSGIITMTGFQDERSLLNPLNLLIGQSRSRNLVQRLALTVKGSL